MPQQNDQQSQSAGSQRDQNQGVKNTFGNRQSEAERMGQQPESQRSNQPGQRTEREDSQSPSGAKTQRPTDSQTSTSQKQ